MLLSQAEPYIGDYLGSEHLLFLNPEIKEYAEAVLRGFFQHAAQRGAEALESLKAKTVEVVLLEDMGRITLPVAAKRVLPDLLEGFFGYLKDSGRFPAAGGWQVCVESMAARFRGAIREDGSLRGETFKKQYAKVGRNDPCPCGSGKKFKQCCGPLIGV